MDLKLINRIVKLIRWCLLKVQRWSAVFIRLLKGIDMLIEKCEIRPETCLIHIYKELMRVINGTY